MGWIYMIRNKKNNKCYIGQTIYKRVEKRWSAERNNPHGILKHAFKRHGMENFSFEVLHENIPNEKLNDIEILEIKQRNTLAPNGYNLQAGGQDNHVCHPETRQKISVTKKNNTTVSEETKQKIRETKKGTKLTQEHKDAISRSSKGKKLAPETIQKIAEFTRRKVDKFSLDGKFVYTFRSMRDAAKSMNVDYTAISKCCNNKVKTAYKFIWKFHTGDTKNLEIKPYIHPLIGQKRPIDIIQKTALKISKAVSKFSIDGSYIETFKSLKDAAECTGVTSTAICRCCSGKTMTSGGFIWKYHINSLSPVIETDGVSLVGAAS
jgi:group I intron endonuclease